MAEQLGLTLPSVPALGRTDFLVADSNRVAVGLIEGWQGWTTGKLLLCGPEGAGKTHLAHVWANNTGARIIDAVELARMDVAEVAHGPAVIEDVPRIACDSAGERALFHLHNLMLAEKNPLLMTGRGRPRDWRFALPDLSSRIDGTPLAQLEPPDDTLLAAVLAKLFADRQLAPAPDLIEFLLRRIDRSFAAAQTTVELLDSASLAQKRPVTRAFAARVLEKKRAEADPRRKSIT
jgi:chromosomal replication initiation ATPase DnaA